MSSNTIYGPMDNIGKLRGVNILTSVASSGVTTYTLSAGKKGVMFQNSGTKPVFFGDASVATATSASTTTGIELFPKDVITFRNVTQDFVIGFRTASGSTTVSVLEYD